MKEYQLRKDWVSVEELHAAIRNKSRIALSPESKNAVEECRKFLEDTIERLDKPIYGITTGFGSLHNVTIDKADLAQLQRNLVVSHACGIGDYVPMEVVKWMLLLKIKGLSIGNSGIQMSTLDRLIRMYNEDLLPVIYQQGSLGASGDLAPLAHLSLPLIGEGQIWQEGKPKPTKEIYWSLGLEPIELAAKEGLALLNGTQFMSAYACHLITECEKLFHWAEAIAAMSLEAFDGREEPFGVTVNKVRQQHGQMRVAENVREWLEGSKGMKRPKKHVQDPYSFRCTPQVLGASRDTFEYVKTIVNREINAVTDNPTIIKEENDIVSAGNFHGQPMALVLDYLAIAMSEVGSISERRTFKLVDGQRGLPEFLVANPGLNSGFMIPQYTAASIASQNKQLCTPASVDSIDSSNSQEDHVSMGANAATKCFRVVENVKRILGIELMNAAQALELRGVEDASEKIQDLHQRFRKVVPFVENDEYMRPLIQKSIQFLDRD